MKFRLTVFLLIIINIYCGAVTLSLRESVVVPRGSDILLSDVVLEDICCDENVIIPAMSLQTRVVFALPTFLLHLVRMVYMIYRSLAAM